MKCRTFLILGPPAAAKPPTRKPDIQMLFYLDVPNRSTLIARVRHRALQENRFSDANEAIIQERLALFDQESKPMLDYYADRPIRRIDAGQPAVLVMKDILHEIVAADKESGYAQLRHLEEVR